MQTSRLLIAGCLGIAVASAYGVVGVNDPCPLPTPYPPPDAAAGVIYNPDMEGGFTNGAANQWVAWKNSNFTGQVHFAGTDRPFSGTASQKLNLPQPLGDGDSAGLYQQIWVVPGATYTATAQVYISFCGTCPIDDVFASIGLDNFGQAAGEGSGMTWCCDNGIYTRNQWIMASVTVTAVEPVMTLSLRATRKWVRDGDGALFWFDHVTFSGPVPTGTRPGQESVPPDPETLIPTTTGPNLVVNPGFEQTFTNGVCAGWNKWSTAGTGTWRQSTRLGKIGGGKYGSGGDAEIATMHAKTNLLFGAEPGYDGLYGTADGQYIFPQMDNAIYIGRPYLDAYQDQYKSDPNKWGAYLADKLYQSQLRHPRVDAWQGFNEPDWGGTWQQVVAFEKAFADRCHYWGMKVCSLNLSTGSPGNIWRMVDESYNPSCKDLCAVADYLGQHCYGGPDTDLMVTYNQTPDKSSPCDFAMRPRKFWDMYNRRGWRLPPVVATEGSTWGAWHGVFPPAVIGNDIVTMGAYMSANRWWCGYTNFTCGAYGSGWEGWDIVGQGTIVQDIGNFNSNHPCDAMDGLYSQMFGAGKVHPYNVSDLTPAGLFNGGINQQISGLIAGQSYLIKAWIKWEYRGHPQTQLQFYLGIDPTGQVLNGNAASIDWGTDQLADKALIHEIFSHAWRTFNASGGTASLWLRASQPISDPSFMFYVDSVEVAQLSGPPPTQPVIQLSVGQINVSTTVGVNPPSGSFTVRNAGVSTLNYSIGVDRTWLSVSPTGGTSTGEADTISVNYTAASLATGTYNATITVSDPNATNNPQTIAVTLVVNSTPPPPSNVVLNGDFEGGVQPSGVGTSWTSFATSGYGATFTVVTDTVHGGAKAQRVDNPQPTDTDRYAGVYQVVNTTTGMGYTIGAWNRTSLSGGGQWDLIARLGVDLTGGTSFQAASVTWYEFSSSKNTWVSLSQHVTATGGSMTIFLQAWRKWASGGGGYAWFDDVSAISDSPPPQPVIALSLTSLTPTTPPGSSPAAQTFTVQNSGTGTLSYSVSVNQTWLSVTPSSGTSTGEADTITVNYTTTGLSAGTYNATVTVSDPNAANNPQTVAVTLFVTGPPQPTITRFPATLSPSCTEGGNAASQTFTVQNTGTGTLSYSIGVNQTWLSVSPNSGTSTGETDTISVNYSTAGLAAGTYNATIAISDTNATNSPQTIGVTLVVSKPTARFPDFDHDGDVDEDDLAHLLGCMTGATLGPLVTTCQDTDLDSDGDVDQSDFGILERCLSGMGVPADPNCVN